MKLFHSLLVAAVVAQTTVEPITGGLDPRGRGGKKKAGFKSDKYVSLQIQIKKKRFEFIRLDTSISFCVF